MKLLRLKLNDSFRSLPEGFELIFREDDERLYRNLNEPICLVGINGSGKSNVLEALGEIFSYLDQTFLKFVKQHSDITLINSFELEYLLPLSWDMEFITADSEITLDTEFVHIKIIKHKDYLPSFYWVFKSEEHPIALGMKSILPKRIIGYSSGQNELLSIPFTRIKFRYYNTLIQEYKSTYRDNVEYSRLRYIDYEENSSILLANFLMAKGNEADILKETILIEDIDSFDLIINRNTHKRGTLPIDVDINKLLEFFESKSTNKLVIASDITKHTFENIENLKKELQNNFVDAAGLYTLLKRIGYLNLNFVDKGKIDDLLVSDIEIYNNYDIADFNPTKKLFQISEVRVRKNNVDYPINYKNLSDGEHQFIHVIGTLLMFKDETSLFLFDEPETHFNPQWKYDYTETFKKVTNSHKSQILMTTHDPVLLSGLSKENVVIFNKPNQNVERTYKPDKDLKGMGVDAILTSEIFGLNSTLDSETLNDMIERRKLLVKQEKSNLNEEENEELTKLSQSLKDIDFNKPFADPLYKDFIMALEDLDVYKQADISQAEIKEREEIAKLIMKKLNENGL
ncbi:restriction system-associated AAA family ATPase [Flavobacterium gyeonganense]|uniref:Restriction system-associated AAA family ATPase n=1 Tax=Flavobacterium gyeonganense TaxID=1310418 RepID=A0ABV5H6I7_9FLAO|nr:restriction system-associated AAA family ATPase [Flavobacterium gyeonganense]